MLAVVLRVSIRAWRRALLVAIALTMAASIYGYYRIMIGGMADSSYAIATMSTPPGDVLAYHYPAFPITLSDNLMTIKGVSDSWFIHQKMVWTMQGYMSLLSVDPSNTSYDIQGSLKIGSLPKTNNEVCIAQSVGRIQGLNVGSIISVEGGQSYEVVGLLKDGAFLPVPFGPDSLSFYAYMLVDGLSQYNRTFVFLDEDAPRGTRSLIEQRIADSGGRVEISSDGVRSVRSFVSQMVLVMSGLVLLATALLQMNMLVITLIGARKEIEAMRAFGMTDGAIGLFSVCEALLSGLFSLPLLTAVWMLVFPRIVPRDIHYLMETRLLTGILVGCFVLSLIGGMASFRVAARLQD